MKHSLRWLKLKDNIPLAAKTKTASNNFYSFFYFFSSHFRFRKYQLSQEFEHFQNFINRMNLFPHSILSIGLPPIDNTFNSGIKLNIEGIEYQSEGIELKDNYLKMSFLLERL
ncbi:hypothetical protein Mgra_00003362 [Meloidogyne graminicola]|uniref:Uncharacterized protein n=1 Tax=Meloidogyne graminicola TaxID=189291 RepID=A0A8S9ZUD5_9BILA|nr:hypothetical protein Mgra_00003362 [Meloidogyne graminicola]